MASYYTAQPEHSDTITAARTMASIPPRHSTAAIMPNAFNNTLNNPTFYTNVREAPPTSLDILHRRVAPNAILNAGGRADKVRCHPGTREEVIGRVEKWADAPDGQTAPIFWLNGPAGAGKSAIMQTVAERRKGRKEPQASFFFFRGDSTRSHAPPLVATLLHQIIQLNPSLKHTVATILSDDPLIFDTPLEDQLETLLFAPLSAIQHSSSTYRTLLLLIDGLDECDSETKTSQERLLFAFDTLFKRHSTACPIRLLIASRDEPQIKIAFTRVSSDRVSLYLDDWYSPANDIRIFVEDQFRQVKKSYGRLYTLDANWPSVKDVNYIVEKSSGQFIYASTIMGFISGSSAHPVLSLDRVKGAEKFATHSPFPHLDAIYTYILSQVDDQTTLRNVLRAHILLTKTQQLDLEPIPELSFYEYVRRVGLKDALEIFDMPCKDNILLSCLQDLTSLAKYSDGKLLFHHASFSDYLLDQSRSGDYFVEIPGLSSATALKIWKTGRHRDPRQQHLGMCLFMHMTSLPPGLVAFVLDHLLSTLQDFALIRKCWRVIRRIGNLCISDDDVAVFREFMYQVVYSNNHIGVFSDSKIRFNHRYRHMILAERYSMPDDDMTAAFRPESDTDRHELASWLKCFLHRVKEETLRSPYGTHSELADSWASWIDSHDTFLDITYLEIAPTKSEFDRWSVRDCLLLFDRDTGGGQGRASNAANNTEVVTGHTTK